MWFRKIGVCFFHVLSFLEVQFGIQREFSGCVCSIVTSI